MRADREVRGRGVCTHFDFCVRRGKGSPALGYWGGAGEFLEASCLGCVGMIGTRGLGFQGLWSLAGRGCLLLLFGLVVLLLLFLLLVVIALLLL